MPSPPGVSFATRGHGVWAGVSAQAVSALPPGEAQPAGQRGLELQSWPGCLRQEGQRDRPTSQTTYAVTKCRRQAQRSSGPPRPVRGQSP